MSTAQIEQLMAPIALYPDALLAQVLMAATYPMEVVHASRWLGREGRATLEGEALVAALRDEPWDASVKSLVAVPVVLLHMNTNLEWTQQVGDAFLAQPRDVFRAIQALRRRARLNGTLASGSEQTVAETDEAIVVEPTDPTVGYVPIYDPDWAYGGWPYPDYPPIYLPPPPGLGAALIAGIIIASRVPIATPHWGWARPAWRDGDIRIDADRVRRIDRTPSAATGDRWQHDVRHRQGVAYRTPELRDRFQGGRDPQRAAREQYRGHADGQRAAGRDGPRALEGIGDGADARAASRRGAYSRPTPAPRAGGFGRGGGGRGGRR
ncbi:MAG: DUF3300 domain-containing protein [Alphaproteobacteria bacterium]